MKRGLDFTPDMVAVIVHPMAPNLTNWREFGIGELDPKYGGKEIL